MKPEERMGRMLARLREAGVPLDVSMEPVYVIPGTKVRHLHLGRALNEAALRIVAAELPCTCTADDDHNGADAFVPHCPRHRRGPGGHKAITIAIAELKVKWSSALVEARKRKRSPK